MRSLILGATGQIGAHLYAACEAREFVTLGTYCRRPAAECVPLDMRDDIAVSDLIADFQPEVIYLAAGLSQIDYAETQPGECYEINVGGVETVTRAAANADVTVVYVSSDQVFGDSKSPRREDDLVNPPTVLGMSHAQAEAAVRAARPGRHLILRTSHVFGSHALPRNPALAARRRLVRGDGLNAADDRFVQPTYGPDLAHAAIELAMQEATGTVHAVGPDRMTEYTFARQVAFIDGYDCDLVRGVSAASLNADAPRPLSPWLDRAKSRQLLGPRAFQTTADGLRMMRMLPAVVSRAA